MNLTIEKLMELIISSSKEEPATSERGPEQKGESRTIYRSFWPTERYVVDCAPDFASGGWKQYDTPQDAPYFGCWFSKDKLASLCYAEGDWILVVCTTEEAFNEEVAEAEAFYEKC